MRGEKYWIVPHTTITTLALVVAQPPHNPAPVPVSRNMRISVSPVRLASTLLRAEPVELDPAGHHHKARGGVACWPFLLFFVRFFGLFMMPLGGLPSQDEPR